jgi:tRNA pseudouridine38-40 synthase
VEIGDGLFAFEVTGNGFLYNMVRILFGTLVNVAYKKIKPEEIKNIIEAKNRAKAGKTMPSKALILKKVDYDI